MVSQAHRLTYEDYLRMPEDGHRYEVVEGELLVSAAPSLRHQTVLANLYRLVDAFVRSRNLGHVFFAPITVLLTRNEPVEPDLVFISAARKHIAKSSAVHGAPDLLVEVTSPSTSGRDRVTKFNRYAQVGVAEYWIVDPVGETVDQFVLEGGVYRALVRRTEDRLGSNVIPGLDISLRDVFET